MEAIMNVVGWFMNKENIEGIFAIVGAFYVFALAVVKMTPTPKDDEVLAKVWEVVGKFTGIKK